MAIVASLNVLHVTDTHILSSQEATLLGVNTAEYFRKVIHHAFSHQSFDFVLLTGDLAQDPCPTSYQYLKDYLHSYQTPCLCLPGNHDDYDIMQQVFNSDSINCRKQTLWDHWQLISLNSQIMGANGGYLADEELSFLQTCLSSKPNQYALIAVHHHCVPTNSTWMDTMMISNHSALFDMISDYPQVRGIIHGHIHQALDTMLGFVRVMATPSTCFQFKPQSKDFALDNTSPGYRIVKLFADGHIQSQVIRLPELVAGLQMDTLGY